MDNNSKLIYQSRSFLIKALSAGFLLIVIGILTFYLSLVKQPVNRILKPEYTAHVYPYSIDFSKNDESKAFILKISPSDDYYYLENTKNHFINQPNFKENKNYFEEFVLLFERVFVGDNRLIWHVGPKGESQIKATYSVANQKNGGVQVMRKLNTDLKISAIGQSVIICSLCMVRDNAKIFFDAGLINDSKLLIAQKLGFSSLVVSKTQVMPISGTKLVVIDQAGNSLAQINIEKNQEVFFDEKYNLIEFKTPLGGEEKIVSQVIKF